MQRVPQIRIFGSSGYEWRKGSIDKYEKKFVDTWTSSVSSPYTFTKSYDQSGVNKTQTNYMKRSSSVSKLNQNSKPFETNYYANAVKICDNNRVLNNIKGHGIEYLNSGYIVKGCRRPLRSQCSQCQAQARRGLMMKQNCNGSHASQIKVQNNMYINKIQNDQNSYRTNKQSQTNYMNYYEEEQITSNRQNKQKNQPHLMKTTHSAKKIVSFQQIIDSTTQIKQPTFRPIQQQNKQLKFKQISTQKSFNQKQNNNNQQNKIVIIESKCQSMVDKQNQLYLKQQQINKSIKKQSYLLPEISCLINELSLIGSLGQVQSTSFMLDELKQAARKDLQVRKNCINRLDEIIDKYGSEKKQSSHIQVIKSS